MQVIRQRQIVNDTWQLDSGEAPLPAGDVIVPLKRWQNERAALLAHDGKLGLLLASGESLDSITADLKHFALLALSFDAFADGRSYSKARLLRERYGFNGEIRALGQVVRDQIAFMERVGFDSFALREDQDYREALSAFADISVVYQPAQEGESIFRQRGWRLS